MMKPAVTQGLPRPALVHSLVTGFNLVASNIRVILLPVALDLFLWLGPHLRLKKLIEPLVARSLNILQANPAAPGEMSGFISTSKEMWSFILERFNLFSLLAGFPVGVPSFVSSTLPVKTPAGQPMIIEVGSFLSAFTAFVILSLIGTLLGTFFFLSIARLVQPDRKLAGFTAFPHCALHSFLLGWIFILALALLILPFSLLASVLALFNVGLAQIVLFIVGFIAIWLVIPFIFSPHGIFAYRLNVFSSIINSARVMRYFLPNAGMFILALFIIFQGLNVIWNMAQDDTWFMVISILGHAFISTGLLTASFIYYRTGTEWIRDFQRRTREAAGQVQETSHAN
ncbi:MAG TPA: hypothetical protein VIO61_15655 [Anaerolineaceae bacterium]